MDINRRVRTSGPRWIDVIMTRPFETKESVGLSDVPVFVDDKNGDGKRFARECGLQGVNRTVIFVAAPIVRNGDYK